MSCWKTRRASSSDKRLVLTRSNRSPPAAYSMTIPRWVGVRKICSTGPLLGSYQGLWEGGKSSSSVTNSLLETPPDIAVALSHSALRIPPTAERCLCRPTGTGATSTDRESATHGDVLAAHCLLKSLQGHVSRLIERMARQDPTGVQGMWAPHADHQQVQPCKHMAGCCRNMLTAARWSGPAAACCGADTGQISLCKPDLLEANDIGMEEGAVVDDLPLDVLVNLQARHCGYCLATLTVCRQGTASIALLHRQFAGRAQQPLSCYIDDLQAGHCECCPLHCSILMSMAHCPHAEPEEYCNSTKLCTMFWPKGDSLSLQMLLLQRL